jgi:hypothetical protein
MLPWCEGIWREKTFGVRPIKRSAEALSQAEGGSFLRRDMREGIMGLSHKKEEVSKWH